MQKLRTNKLEPKVLGPFLVRKYDKDRWIADVVDPNNNKV